MTFRGFQSPFAIRQRWITRGEPRTLNKRSNRRFVKSADLWTVEFVGIVATIILLVTKESFVDALSIGAKMSAFGTRRCSAHEGHQIFALGQLP